MPVCSYLVVADGDPSAVADRLGTIPGCDAIPAENRDVVIVVTDTTSTEQEARVRQQLEAAPGVQSLVMTFGEIDPDTEEGDPMASSRKRRKRPLVNAMREVPSEGAES